MKQMSALIIHTLFFLCSFGQTDTINQRIFLIGDAGDLMGDHHPVIDWLKKNVDWNDDKNTVIYLGDNVYPLGLPMKGDPTYPPAKKVLDYQISLVQGKKGRAFFVPGNHDWRNGKLGGWEQVMNQEDYINNLQEKNIQAWPINGCPGPVAVELTDKVVLALLDSQWFLFLHDKPGLSSTCESKTLDEFEIELHEIAAEHPNQLLIVAMHHPIYSYGPHGGDYTLKEHIFPLTAINPKLYIPLPILGSLYPLARGVFGSIQDVYHPLYQAYIHAVLDAIKGHANTVVASGHDHGLQFIMRDTIPFIVSGSGSNLTRIKPGRFSQFSDRDYGFAMLEIWNSGKTDVRYYNLNSTSLSTPTFAKELKPIEQVTPVASMDTTRPVFDSMAIAAANPALKGNALKRRLMGENYRKEWTQPLHVRVLDMGTEQGGLKPLKQGGGKQTKSLRVEDPSGKEWALRSIEKYPEAAIPPDLRETFAKDLLADGISASYPYGALSMGPLSQAAGVPYLKDKLVYIPDDPRLDRFRSTFKNTLALMEERKPDSVGKTYNTDELVLRLARDNDNHVDQKALLKIRMLDNFVMDFDRHEGQWDWATFDTGKGKIYYPIPKDRDQVFFMNEGILPKMARRPWLVPELQGFKAHAENIKTFNRPARNMDRFFLNELTESDWRVAADTFLQNMTDEVIENALHQQPQEIHPYQMQRIINTLKERRKYFLGEMMEYYRFISKTVTIVGSNKRELFTIDKNNDGSVHVVVNKIAKDSTISSKIYDRVFDPKVTKELRIFGLNDDDSFVVTGGKSPIKIRLIGGAGNDAFVNNSSSRDVLVYDASFEQNHLSGSKGFKRRIKADPQVNRFDRLAYKYDYVKPELAFEYNVDDGIFIGAKATRIHQGFRKEPYQSRQFISASHALKTSSYHFRFDADWIHVLGNSDLLVRSDFRAPVNVTNFFGIGNNTIKDDRFGGDHNHFQYYRIRYNIGDMTAYWRHQLQSWMRINIGPTFQFFSVDSAQNSDKYINEVYQNGGVDRSTLYKTHLYAGYDARIDIDSKNDEVIPTRGFMMNAGIRSLYGLNTNSNNITQLNVDMRVYMSLASKKRLVLATRIGWAHNLGNYEIPQAQYLGQNMNLRGFRNQRFAGRTSFFNNSELRVRLANFNTYLFAGSMGINVFNDVGRVWADNEASGRWHDGYGAGVWIAPINRILFNVNFAHSNEERVLPTITIGFQF